MKYKADNSKENYYGLNKDFSLKNINMILIFLKKSSLKVSANPLTIDSHIFEIGIYMYRPVMLPGTPFVGDDGQSEIRRKAQKKK